MECLSLSSCYIHQRIGHYCATVLHFCITVLLQQQISERILESIAFQGMKKVYVTYECVRHFYNTNVSFTHASYQNKTIEIGNL